MQNLVAAAFALQEHQTALRRDFHHYAESAWTEFRTASLIARELAQLGYEVKLGREVICAEERMGLLTEEELEQQYQRALSQGAVLEYAEKMRGGFTGVVGILKNGEGPIIGMRFDIDAVEMNEPQTKERRPGRDGFASVNAKMMHSCGHDGHASIGLGVAQLLMQYRNQFKGTIKLVFQPAEEGGRGARPLTATGILDDVEYMLGAHLGSSSPVGSLLPGQAGMLATSKFDAIFTGKAAHAGGNPDGGKNALLAAANAALNLYAISRHKAGATRINVGRLQAGTGRNVIPDHAVMAIETRGDTSELDQYMYGRAMQVLQGSAMMYDCELELKQMGSAKSGSSSPELMQRVIRVATELGCFDQVSPSEGKLGGSEDFTYMMERVKQNGGQVTYMGIGASLNKGEDANASAAGGAHTIDFDIDERCLPLGSAIFTALALDIAALK